MALDILAQLPPEMAATIGAATTALSSWLWQKHGKPTVEKAGAAIKGKGIDENVWEMRLIKYRNSLLERVAFIHILGRHDSEVLENVFTHVNVLDKITATRWYDVERLKTEFDPRDFARQGRMTRLSGEEAVAQHNKLFILGKPGAGKTTFLKYTALRAIKGEMGNRVPIFVSLKELSDSGQPIFDFIVAQFATHRFPQARPFVEAVLQAGDALLLFDGLDEVNLEGDKRRDMITALNAFVYQYTDCPMLITCRVAATDYSFKQFSYVEMADFDTAQIGSYIDKWFHYDTTARDKCRRDLLETDANKPVRELAQTPLILALLCLVYEELKTFPAKRHEIYGEATRALLSKWDASRNIARDGIYKGFSLEDKQELLAYIAAQTFERRNYFLEEDGLVEMIDHYLVQYEDGKRGDGEAVLNAIAAQHGIIVERARRIHSFSHLTLQEYYTARYVVRHERRGTVRRLLPHVGDDRWKEVFLLTAMMLSDGTAFCEQYMDATTALLQGDEQLLACLAWCEEKHNTVEGTVGYKSSAIRAWYFGLSRPRSLNLDLSRALSSSLSLDIDIYIALDRLHTYSIFSHSTLSRALSSAAKNAAKLGYENFSLALCAIGEEVSEHNAPGQEWEQFNQTLEKTIADHAPEYRSPYETMPVDKSEIDGKWRWTAEQAEMMVTYLKANQLLVDCIQVARLTGTARRAIEAKILLPGA